MRIYDNLLDIPGSLVQSRLRELDRNATALVYEARSSETMEILARYAAIDSDVLTDEQIIPILVEPPTQAEREEYQKTLDNLQTIANLTNPTNAQVVQAINYLARTLRLIIKHFIRYY